MQSLDKDGVTSLIKNVVDAWNRHDLNSVCAFYAEDASFISESKHVRGNQNILKRYQENYPDSSSMGTLALDIVEIRPNKDILYKEVFFASAILKWNLRKQDGQLCSGFSLVTFEQNNEQIRIAQDMSV